MHINGINYTNVMLAKFGTFLTLSRFFVILSVTYFVDNAKSTINYNMYTLIIMLSKMTKRSRTYMHVRIQNMYRDALHSDHKL